MQQRTFQFRDLVRVEALSFFGDLVHELGGDPQHLLRLGNVKPETLQQSNAFLPYRIMVALLELAAETLECPDFGMRLAKRQNIIGILGPLDVAMRNSRTLGDAFRYCAEHVYTYSSSTDLSLEHDTAGNWVLRFDILLDRIPDQRQAVEHALLATHLNVRNLTGGKARPHQIWFTHDPVSALVNYREHFGSRTCFGQAFNALFLSSRDETTPVLGSSKQLYEIATKFIDVEFPEPETLISTRVRSLISQQLPECGALHTRVASALGMHPRTLQRRLRDEGFSFESIKDKVRREAAWRYLSQTHMPLIRIALLLGYSELSAFSRSCNRWFSLSPREIRQREKAATVSKDLLLVGSGGHSAARKAE